MDPAQPYILQDIEVRVLSGEDTRKYQARPLAEVILVTLDQFTQSKRHGLCAEPFLLLGYPTSIGIDTQVRLSDSLPSLHSLPLDSLNPVSLLILFLCRSRNQLFSTG